MPLTEKDRQLVNDLLTGTAGAWTVFVDRYANLIVQVVQHTAHAHSLKLTRDDVEDLTADVFSTLLERNMGAIRGFRGRSSFATYLTVVVRRVVLRKLTQRRYLQAFGHVQAHQVSVVEASEDHGSRQVEARDEVDSLMTRLPQPLRTVVESCYLNGHSYREISRLCRVPMNSIGPMLARARELLRQRAPYGR
ncbi:MAG: sigma-70 family RNA polymerase sigma factor [Fuerstiella sp.]